MCMETPKAIKDLVATFIYIMGVLNNVRVHFVKFHAAGDVQSFTTAPGEDC